MCDKKAVWNSNQKKLKELLKNKQRFNEFMDSCLYQHNMVHSSEMSGIEETTLEDDLWEGLTEAAFRTKVNNKGRTIAYGIWHSSRIEDITVNILLADDTQVINSDNWLDKMNVSICDTGNALSPEEILEFSRTINMNELKKYRQAVGRKTIEVLKKLTRDDLNKKIEKGRLKRVLDEGAVLNVEASMWLIDFWGKKNVAGILLMPVTRHNLVHFNESMAAKKKKH
ncbi:DinB family protein [Abyssisolibacter fermentans]|uniref:DinB family protein n=1 Tax=Abyssisolibacter fermentans TaxID=1766203 RepID=UPI00082ECE50|nr:DinB family protein [Abyssisolibacter fermentans]